MIYTKLGNTAIEVSKLCLGTMTFGEQNTESEAHEQLDYAVAQGINFIDTAELYSVPGRKETQGSTERYIGSWLKSRSCRERIILATKITGPSLGLSYIRNPLNFSKEQINIAIDGSLQRLQTDYVDIYQLHWPERNVNSFGKLGYEFDENEKWKDNFLEILTSLNELIKQGKIRHCGVSNETPWGVMNFLRKAEQNGLPKPITIQNPYNLLNRSFEVGLAEVSIRENIGLMAYSPMAFGMLSGKYHDGSDVQNSRIKLFPKLPRYSGENTFKVAEMYIKIAKKYGLSPAQMSLAFVNTRPFLCSNIIAATTMDQL
ncbi:MAG: aldo/keto reductase, partial [Cyclobacteriaceae bacterium]|nr:aldo/keto reductase [Cyclobacteriaceae bacterium]